MNRSLPFGMHSFGRGHAIKINIKLTKKDAEELSYAFPTLWLCCNERNGYEKNIALFRIEGYIPSKDMQDFMVKYTLAKEFTKIAKAEQNISDLLESQIPVALPEFVTVGDEPSFFV